MNRIQAIFQPSSSPGGNARQPTAKALMPFVTAGDPDLATTQKLLPAMQAAGAAICEIGIPFSDPIADGPVIQASMAHALDQNVTVIQIFDMVAQQRESLAMGLVAMVSYSIVHRLGPKQFVRDAQQAGMDGFIFPDLPLEEAEQMNDLVREAGLISSMLISPTTPIERAERIAAASSGFIYLLSRAGITGEQAALPTELPDRIQRIRDVTDLPIAVGFGIGTAQQVRQVVSVADAAIVGSAVMRRVAKHREAGSDAVVAGVSDMIADLAEGLSS